MGLTDDSVSQNNLGDEAGKALAEMLKVNQTLQHLELVFHPPSPGPRSFWFSLWLGVVGLWGEARMENIG